jgi:hypothetical protein
MQPGILPGKTPPFHELGEYVFQGLCRDLFDAEPDIAVCEIYGTRGQSQDGIDLLSYRRDRDGMEVGQCKCYEKFPPKDIETASDDFFAHWENRWHKEDIKRFILFVASDLSRREQQDEINRQRKRFKGFQISYEAWSAAKIRNKLRPHEGIVRTYFTTYPDYWVSVICGATTPPSVKTFGIHETQTEVVVSTALLSTIEQLAGNMSSQTEQQIELVRKAWREGQRDQAVKWVNDTKNNQTLWPHLSPVVKAKVLRLEAGLEMYLTGDIERSKQLADEAFKLSPSDDQARLRSLIARMESGPEEAIKILEGREDIDSLNLKAAFLLEMGRVQECLATLNPKNRGSE